MGADNDIVERANDARERFRAAIAGSESLWRSPTTLSDEQFQEILSRVLDAHATLIAIAPAMPNGVEGHYAENLLAAACLLENTGEIINCREAAVLRTIAAKLRAADNRDAAGVDDPVDEQTLYEQALYDGLNYACDIHPPSPACTPAAVPAGEAVAYSVVQIGNRGAAYDPPNTHRAFTYEHQPGNIDASRLGRATKVAAAASAGDSIDRGLALLKSLQEEGFGVFQIGTPAPVQAAPQEGEWNAAIEAAASEAEHWQALSGSTHKCGDYIAGAIRTMKRAALQHRGDSQEVGRG